MPNDNEDFLSQIIFASDTKAGGLGDIHIPSAVETQMRGREIGTGYFESMQGLTQAGAAKNALRLPVASGTRVRFKANTGSLLTYENPPDPNAEGEVVSVHSASGNITAHNDFVFVKWDDKRFLPIHAEHLERVVGHTRQGSPNKIRVASLGDLGDFLKLGEDTLVHRATKDLWSLKEDGEGFVIERLFDTQGDPLKV